jgi:hypothetical protein
MRQLPISSPVSTSARTYRAGWAGSIQYGRPDPAEEFMGHREIVLLLHPVMGHQQPARETLLTGMTNIAGRCSRDLLEIRHHRAMQGSLQAWDALQSLAKCLRVYPQRGGRHRHHELEAITVAAVEEGPADHAFGANHAHFRAAAIVHGNKLGGHCQFERRYPERASGAKLVR